MQIKDRILLRKKKLFNSFHYFMIHYCKELMQSNLNCFEENEIFYAYLFKIDLYSNYYRTI